MKKVESMDEYIKGVLSYARQFEYAQQKKTSEFFYDLADYLKSLPTVEAKPVVKGEWIKIKDWDENDNALFECNNCHYGDTHAKAMKVPYCWHCGAKMSYAERGGKNE